MSDGCFHSEQLHGLRVSWAWPLSPLKGLSQRETALDGNSPTDTCSVSIEGAPAISSTETSRGNGS